MNKLFVLSLISIFCVGLVSAAWTSNLNTDLLSYWKFDESTGILADDSLNFNDFDLINTPSWINGILETGIYFDNASSEYAINNSVTNRFNTFDDISDSITINFWFFLNSSLSNDFRYIINRQGHFIIGINNQKFSLILCDSTGCAGSSSRWNSKTTHTSTNAWHMITLRYNGTGINGAEMFINGSTTGVDNQVYGGIWNFQNSALTLATTNTTTPFVKIGMDELSIWNRSLSDAEVTQLYNSGTGITYPLADVNVDLISPINNSAVTGNVSFVANFTPESSFTNINLTNTTLFVWYDNGTLFTTEVELITGNETNTSTIVVTNLTDGNFIWNEYGCFENVTNTFCSFATNNFSFTWRPFEVTSETYNDFTYETALEGFNISFLYDPTDFNSLSAALNYDGVNYTGTQYVTGASPSFFVDLSIPLIVNNSENKTFFWYVTLTSDTETQTFASTQHQQNVSKVTLSLCGVGETPYLRFFTKNSENPFPALNATFKSAWEIKLGEGSSIIGNFSYEDTTEVNNTWEFCINPNTENYTINVDVEVDAVGFSKNFYYITNAEYISNETTNISLYLLNESLSTVTILRVRNKAQTRLQNVLIFIQQYDVGTDTFQTVGIAKTNEEGEDAVYLNWYDILYKFILIQNGETVLVSNTTKIFDTPKIFEIDTEITYSFDKFRNFEYSLTFNDATNNFVLSYVKPSGLVEEGCLRVIKRTALNDTNICLTCSESSSATLYCNIASAGNGTFIASFYATGSWYLLDSITESVGVGFSEQINALLNQDDAAFYTILLSGLVLSMFLFNPILGILGMLLGLFASASLGFFVVDYYIFIGIVLMGGFIIWILKR